MIVKQGKIEADYESKTYTQGTEINIDEVCHGEEEK